MGGLIVVFPHCNEAPNLHDLVMSNAKEVLAQAPVWAWQMVFAGEPTSLACDKRYGIGDVSRSIAQTTAPSFELRMVLLAVV